MEFDERHQRATERLARYRSRGDLPGGAEHQLSFDTGAAVDEARRQGIEAQADAGHAVA